MSTKGYIDVSEFSTVNDTFDNVDWLASITVSYNPATNQTTYETLNTRITTTQYKKDHKPKLVHTCYQKTQKLTEQHLM